MILSSRNKIRLSKTLHAQTTPYPRMSVWIKRSVFILILIAGSVIYITAQPSGKPDAGTDANAQKEILGEQNPPTDGTAALEAYVVKKGDTLFNVSQKYNISWQTLAKINNLREPYLLKIGQQLLIPIGSD